jgi:hypothetical protein
VVYLRYVASTILHELLNIRVLGYLCFYSCWRYPGIPLQATLRAHTLSGYRAEADRRCSVFVNVRIWTPPRFACKRHDGDKVRLRTYIRPLQLAYVDAGPSWVIRAPVPHRYSGLEAPGHFRVRLMLPTNRFWRRGRDSIARFAGASFPRYLNCYAIHLRCTRMCKCRVTRMDALVSRRTWTSGSD